MPRRFAVPLVPLLICQMDRSDPIALQRVDMPF
jgi:hypothetical protein